MTYAGFQGLCAFLTVTAYGIAILQNGWYHFDLLDWAVYRFERSRLWPPPPSSSSVSCTGCGYLIICPVVTVLADLVSLRLLPPLVTCLMVCVC